MSDSRALAIPDALLAAVYAHARSTFPAECCGYLVGARDREIVDGHVPCRNAQVDGEHPTHPERGADTGFVIAGAELFALARTFEGARPARIVYHSHGNGRAYLSAIDRDLGGAYPVQHLVIGVRHGDPMDTGPRVVEAAQFALAEVGDFVEVARWSVE